MPANPLYNAMTYIHNNIIRLSPPLSSRCPYAILTMTTRSHSSCRSLSPALSARYTAATHVPKLPTKLSLAVTCNKCSLSASISALLTPGRLKSSPSTNAFASRLSSLSMYDSAAALCRSVLSVKTPGSSWSRRGMDALYAASRSRAAVSSAGGVPGGGRVTKRMVSSRCRAMST